MVRDLYRKTLSRLTNMDSRIPEDRVPNDDCYLIRFFFQTKDEREFSLLTDVNLKSYCRNWHVWGTLVANIFNDVAKIGSGLPNLNSTVLLILTVSTLQDYRGTQIISISWFWWSKRNPSKKTAFAPESGFFASPSYAKTSKLRFG